MTKYRPTGDKAPPRENQKNMIRAINRVREIADSVIGVLPAADDDASDEADRLVARLCKGRKRWTIPQPETTQ